jgi:SecD/SecF fusion protein
LADDTSPKDTSNTEVSKVDNPANATKDTPETPEADAKKPAKTPELPTGPAVTDGEFTQLDSKQAILTFRVFSKDKEKKLSVVVYYSKEEFGENTSKCKNTGRLFPSRLKGKEEDYTVTLTGLEPNTDYFYRIRAKDSIGTTWSKSTQFTTTSPGRPFYESLAIFIGILAAFIVPFWLGGRIAKGVRMPEQGWRIGIILCSLTLALIIIKIGWPPSLGIDLEGGVIMIYEIDEEETARAHAQQAAKADDDKPDPGIDEKERMKRLLMALGMRINPGGEKEISIRQYGRNQVEITIPKADVEKAKRIKKSITEAGTLSFRILANPDSNKPEHQAIISLARANEEKMANPPSEIKQNGKLVGWWNPVNMKREDDFDYMRKREDIVTRMANIGGIPRLEVLMIKDPYNVTGDFLSRCTVGIDSGRPSVRFSFNAAGANRFGALTLDNLPVEGAQPLRYHLGIILNGDLYSAPTINSRITSNGVITGDFSQEEAQDLVNVLNAGSLPAVLKKNPIFEWSTGPTLGKDTVQRGKIAITISVVIVLIFMAIYYGFAGLVACGALLMNIILLFGIMIGIHADFTLPGIAGLVLTVGMAVDANVLIFERIREELSRGAALRMAIRNGFAKATTTIVDANVTTLITAVILFVVGTQQIKGFAVTLFLGVTLSMFTAIFCARVVFDIAERRNLISKLSMMRILGKTNINFVKMQTFGLIVSGILICIGLIAVFNRGNGVLDIDFTGGESVTIVFKEAQDIGTLRKQLSDELELPDLAIMDATPEGADKWTYFVINTSLEVKDDKDSEESAIDVVEQKLFEFYGDKLQTNYLKKHEVVELDAEGQPLLQPASSNTTTVPSSATSAASTFLADDDSTSGKEKKPGNEETTGNKTEGENADAPLDNDSFANGSEVTLVFGTKLDYNTMHKIVKDILAAAGMETTVFELSNQNYTPNDTAAYKEWTLRIAIPKSDIETKILEPLRKSLDKMPFFPASSSIGSRVAGDYKTSGILAIVASLICIVGYIWIRFQRVVFGLAAVVALIHDVLITLGAIAISAYVASALGFLGIEDFKISLTVLAAFLTIIGYSLNDTIVVFDRIREVRGKAPNINGDMVNTSINQTLSRTLLTSLTTFIVVLVLYIGGGSGIHAFSFTLMIGVIVGTYSSVFVASPVLLWLSRGDMSTTTTKK